jgi:N6-adenosine-specific RNA methylase IME4
MSITAADLLSFAGGRKFGTIPADPPWRFQNKTGKVAPEHRRLSRYGTMSFDEIEALPIPEIAAPVCHLYLWCPNALLPWGLHAMEAWGFTYKSNIVWHKVRKDGGSDGRGVGFYFRNVTELVLFGTRGKNARTRAAGRRQVNYLATRKREHSRKPDEIYPVIEACRSALISNCSLAAPTRIGTCGATKPMTPTSRLGKHTHITRRSRLAHRYRAVDCSEYVRARLTRHSECPEVSAARGSRS